MNAMLPSSRFSNASTRFFVYGMLAACAPPHEARVPSSLRRVPYLSTPKERGSVRAWSLPARFHGALLDCARPTNVCLDRQCTGARD
jgi:hypothetical protein